MTLSATDTDLLADTCGASITATGDAWEYVYDVLADLTRRGIAVIVNGEHLVKLLRIEGNLYGDVKTTLVGQLWDEDDKDYSGSEVWLRMFEDTGEIAIKHVHVI